MSDRLDEPGINVYSGLDEPSPEETGLENPVDGEIEDAQGVTPVDRLLLYSTLTNLLEWLDGEDVQGLGQRVIRETDIDLASRSHWEERMKSALDIALQVKQEKTFPWPGAANVKYPLITNAAIEFAARAYPALVPGRNLVKGVVNGLDDQEGSKRERADRTSRHLSWQLLHEETEWEQDTDRILHIVPITGVCWRKVYFSPHLGRQTSEIVPPQDCIINYEAPSQEAAPRITHRYYLYPHEVEERMRAGVWSDKDLGLPREAEGDEDAPHEFLEQHRRSDLDGDGYAEPYIVTVHRDSGEILRIVAGFGQEEMVWDDQGRIVRVERREWFIKYGFIPNPESAIYDLGFGQLLTPINETCNTVLNQLLDAGTLANTGGGFIGRGARLKGGALRFAPGEYKPVDVPGQSLKENIVPMNYQEPSRVLFELLGFLVEAGRSIASLKDVLEGSQEYANQRASNTQALIEQGLSHFSAILKRLHRALGGELKRRFRLNAEHLDPQKYFRFHDEPEAVSYRDYRTQDLDVEPVSDPSLVTNAQKVAKAEAMMAQFNGDPMINQMELRRRYLESLNVEGVDDLITQPQGPNPEEQREQARLELEYAKEAREAAVSKAEMVDTYARAMERIAQAESEEVGTQLEIYKATVQEMMDQMSPQQGGQRAATQQGRAAPSRSGSVGGPGQV